uniref:Sm protein G n=2 Tax=Chelydra serpentina TaxID=8475 RepID=A0A8C3SER2_CHESE
MSKVHPPELKKFMDKKLSLKLNGGRHVQGILRGFDPFINLVEGGVGRIAQWFEHWPAKPRVVSSILEGAI